MVNANSGRRRRIHAPHLVRRADHRRGRAIGAEQEKAVLVDVIPQAQIESSPSTEVRQIVQKIAPPLNFLAPDDQRRHRFVRPAMLHGLGPDQLLVVINGKRRRASNWSTRTTPSARAVSISTPSPPSAIENIEILRDGAAVQYGSDAIQASQASSWSPIRNRARRR